MQATDRATMFWRADGDRGPAIVPTRPDKKFADSGGSLSPRLQRDDQGFSRLSLKGREHERSEIHLDKTYDFLKIRPPILPQVFAGQPEERGSIFITQTMSLLLVTPKPYRRSARLFEQRIAGEEPRAPGGPLPYAAARAQAK